MNRSVLKGNPQPHTFSARLLFDDKFVQPFFQICKLSIVAMSVFTALFERESWYCCSWELLWRSSECVLLLFQCLAGYFLHYEPLYLSVECCVLLRFSQLGTLLHAVSTILARPTRNVKMTLQTAYIPLHWPPYDTPLLNTRIC